jgi:hypothetical protein
MKNLLLTLAAFSVFLLVGCQENSITDPLSSSTVQKNQTSATIGSIPLDGILKVPGELNSYYDISGTINYTEELIQDPKVPPVQQTHLSVTFSIDADLSNSAPPYTKWNISTTLRDDLYISNGGEEILEEHFSIEGRNDRLTLVCRFLVTDSSVKLESRFLSFEGEKVSKSSSSEPEIFTLPPAVNNNTYNNDSK